mmetsp:Transcript_13059/g.29678  ORF Transcript_13059/g.29678 Transcript_13059/m.29678 type:complete len:257 (+) Transcript_13059:61-831(+)
MALCPATRTSASGVWPGQVVSDDAAEAIDLMRQLIAARSRMHSVKLAVPASAPVGEQHLEDEASPEVQQALHSLADALISLRNSPVEKQVIVEKEVFVPEICTVERIVPQIQTVEVMVPEIRTVERMVPQTMGEKQVRTIERLVPQIQTVEKQVFVPEIRTIERIVPQIQTVEKLVPVPEIRTVDKIVLQPSIYPAQQVRQEIGLMTCSSQWPVHSLVQATGQQARTIGLRQAAQSPPLTDYFVGNDDEELCGCLC